MYHVCERLEAKTPTRNPEIPKNTLRSQEICRKVRPNFSLLPCDMSEKPSRNCTEKVFQMNFLILGGEEMKNRERETDRRTDGQTEKKKKRERERQRDRETERQRDRETERQRDRDRERES